MYTELWEIEADIISQEITSEVSIIALRTINDTDSALDY